MARIIHGWKISTKTKHYFTPADLHGAFQGALTYHQELVKSGKRIAYFFIDPLLNAFEASNQFYCGSLQIPAIAKLNCYKSGAGPLYALADACQLIEHDLYDAVLICGYEPLLTNKEKYGKTVLQEGMNIFGDPSLLSCYNELGHLLCSLLDLSNQDFKELSGLLFDNYSRTFSRLNSCPALPIPSPDTLDTLGGDLFRRADCANPNVDFAGGIIVSNTSTAELLHIPCHQQLEVTGVERIQIEGHPGKLPLITGERGNLFPHLQTIFQQLQQEIARDLVQDLKTGQLLLDVYTCYPPIPLAFLLAGGFINSPAQLPAFLSDHEITITGGLNLAGAPWNNPTLNSIIEMYRQLPESSAPYGLVHGNGGIGEVQGLALFKRYKS